MLFQEDIEFWDLLEEQAEDEEAAIDGPRCSRAQSWISLVSCNDNTRVYGLRTRVNNRVETINNGIGNPIQKAKTSSMLSSYSYRRWISTHCSCPDSLPGRTSPLMDMTSLMEASGVQDLKINSISAFFFSIVAWLSPEIRMTPCRSLRKCSSQSGVLPSLLFGSPRFASASFS